MGGGGGVCGGGGGGEGGGGGGAFSWILMQEMLIFYESVCEHPAGEAQVDGADKGFSFERRKQKLFRNSVY